MKAGLAAAFSQQRQPPVDDWASRALVPQYYQPPNNPESSWMPGNVQPQYDMPGRFHSPYDVHRQLDNMPQTQSEHQPGYDPAQQPLPPMDIQELLRRYGTMPAPFGLNPLGQF